MSPEAITAGATVAGVVVTLLTGMGILIWRAARHSQRIDTAENNIRKLQDGAHEAGKLDTALQVLTGRFDAMQGELKEIGRDVKNMLTGRVTPPSARRSRTD